MSDNKESQPIDNKTRAHNIAQKMKENKYAKQMKVKLKLKGKEFSLETHPENLEEEILKALNS